MAPFKCAPALRWSEADKCNFPGTRSVDLELGLEYPLEAPRRLDPKRPPERLLERGASSALSIRSLLRRLKLVRKVEGPHETHEADEVQHTGRDQGADTSVFTTKLMTSDRCRNVMSSCRSTKEYTSEVADSKNHTPR
ncbi:hypothetical protein MRX96_007995 [Rhipicephalus microplus]